MFWKNEKINYNAVVSEIVIKKSKFIGYAFDVNSTKQVEEILKKMRIEHKKASHICYAYKILSPNILVKASDDNEPSGTAGRPILNPIEKQNLNDILVVVVRYFGGIKLGAGGLIRAYSKASCEAIKEFKKLL